MAGSSEIQKALIELTCEALRGSTVDPQVTTPSQPSAALLSINNPKRRIKLQGCNGFGWLQISVETGTDVCMTSWTDQKWGATCKLPRNWHELTHEQLVSIIKANYATVRAACLDNLGGDAIALPPSNPALRRLRLRRRNPRPINSTNGDHQRDRLVGVA